jgi:HlyD family secretion protein
MIKKLIFLVLLAAAGAAAWVNWPKINGLIAKMRHPEEQIDSAALAAPAVTVTRVKAADFIETASVSGSLIARDEILISPEIEGFRVLELLVEEGSQVKKGDVLARLAAEPLEAQVAQNQAGIARSVAAIARAQSQITEAEARVDEAKSQLERAKPLKKDGYLSGSVYDQRESAAKTSQAQLTAAREFLHSAEADKEQLQAQYREIAWRQARTEVKSPVDGVVSRRNARVGAVASAAGEPMFRIIARGQIELDAEVVETELAKVKEGQKARIIVPGAGDVEGTVRLIIPEIDKTTRLGRVKIALEANPNLKLGAFARGTIETARSHGLAIPAAAAQFEPSGTSVQVVHGDKVEKRVLKTGLIAGEKIEVKDGLNDGDTIVARAGTFLRDGDVIRPVMPAEQLSKTESP